MFIPAILLQATDLIKEGSMEIQIGENSVRVEKDFILLNIYNPDSLQMLLDREDIIPQVKHLSEEFSRTGKTLEIRYRNSKIFRVGYDAHSVVLWFLGMNHVAVGNPVTVYRFLRTCRKS